MARPYYRRSKFGKRVLVTPRNSSVFGRAVIRRHAQGSLSFLQHAHVKSHAKARRQEAYYRKHPFGGGSAFNY